VHIHHLYSLSNGIVERLADVGIPTVLTLWDFWFLCPGIHFQRLDLHPLRGGLWGVNCLVHWETRYGAGLRQSPVDAAKVHLLRPKLMRRAAAAADEVVAPSAFVRDRFRDFGVDARRIRLFRHGIEAAVVGERAAPRRDCVRFGFLGALSTHKGADVVVEAFSRVSADDARLVVRGPATDPAYAEQLRTIAARDVRIQIGPPVPRQGLIDFFQDIDALVVASRVHETFSFVVQEAFANRVPVLASRVGSLAEIVEPGKNGALFRAGDVDQLSECMQQLVDDPHTLQTWTAFPPVQTIEDDAAALLQLYGDVRARAA
jgi:glycosyltransferase involved in cell wall biosynthesis